MGSMVQFTCLLTYLLVFYSSPCYSQLPLVVTTWRFVSAGEEAWRIIQNGSSLDAIEGGCSVCEIKQCDGTVGYGGSPDETGETTLDSLIMDGDTMNVGAIAAIRRIKNVISVARRVLENTGHSMIAGDLATKFAVEMGFKEESLSTSASINIWQKWLEKTCQPNFWENVNPNPKSNCGPYTPLKNKNKNKLSLRNKYRIGSENHDTISMIAIDSYGSIAAGTSTNGAKHKIPGRVGDSPLVGSGAYADSTVGAAVATGDGDVMLRFVPSFLAVEEMRRGTTPSEAARIAIVRIAKVYPSFSGAVIAVNKSGIYGAACHGMLEFPFVVGNPTIDGVHVESVRCTEPYVMKT